MLQNKVPTPFDIKRHSLVQQLRQRGISDETVLAAIATVPRELFVQPSLQSQAYEDSALPIDQRQTISQPYTVAFMTQLVGVRPNMNVLEIGTGSGYQAAVLAAMKARVTSIERHPQLSSQARAKLNSLGYSVTCRIGDGTIGYRDGGPYDAIIVTAGAPDVPEALARQLAIGGKMAVPVGDAKNQTLYLVTRLDVEQWDAKEQGAFTFVPLIGIEGWDDDGR